jgi:hypothetical protein
MIPPPAGRPPDAPRGRRATWQRHEERNAAYFPFHDVTHLAVESVLGFRQASPGSSRRDGRLTCATFSTLGDGSVAGSGDDIEVRDV